MARTSVNNKLLDSHFTWGVVALFVLGTIIYVFPVGQIQPGHYLAPIIILMGASFIRWRDLNPGDKWLSVFGFYTLVINGYYYFSHQNIDFLFSIFKNIKIELCRVKLYGIPFSTRGRCPPSPPFDLNTK
jgi:membrane-bound ClpP family serine protease